MLKVVKIKLYDVREVINFFCRVCTDKKYLALRIYRKIAKKLRLKYCTTK